MTQLIAATSERIAALRDEYVWSVNQALQADRTDVALELARSFEREDGELRSLATRLASREAA